MTRERFGEVKVHIPSMTSQELRDAAGYAWTEMIEAERKLNTMLGELALRGEIAEYPTN